MSKKLVPAVRDSEGPVEYRRGSLQWAVNAMRADLLSNFLNDIQRAEISGIADAECKRVQGELGAFANACTAIPDAPIFRKSLWKVAQDFEEEYRAWNHHDGQDEEIQRSRRNHLKELRKLRHDLAVLARKNIHVLHNEFDLKTIDAIFTGFQKLCRDFPDTFVKVGEAVTRYFDRKSNDDTPEDKKS